MGPSFCRHLRLPLFALLAGLTPPAGADWCGSVQGMGVEGGRTASGDVRVARLNLAFPLVRVPDPEGSWRQCLGFQASLGTLTAADPAPDENDQLTETAARFLFRLHPGAAVWYLEAGTGVVHLSDTTLGSRDLGSLTQFRSHLGLGIHPAPRLELVARLSHTSNAGLAEPNPGINLGTLELAYVP